MTAPTKNWSNISDLQIDADSPIDATLMAQIRDDLVHVREWLGLSYTAAQDHDHDGINSKSAVLETGAVTLGNLKMARGSYSTTANGTHYATLHFYAHYPLVTIVVPSGASDTVVVTHVSQTTGGGTGTFTTREIKMDYANSGVAGRSLTAEWDYHSN